jgi:hypothetical protein
MTPTIHSLHIDAIEGGWHAHGISSLGPINRIGATKEEARQLAKMQVREYVRKYSRQDYLRSL